MNRVEINGGLANGVVVNRMVRPMIYKLVRYYVK